MGAPRVSLSLIAMQAREGKVPLIEAFDAALSAPIRSLELGALDYVVLLFGRTFTGPETAIPAFFVGAFLTGWMAGDSLSEVPSTLAHTRKALTHAVHRRCRIASVSR